MSEKVATKSKEALITYINHRKYDRWVINNYAHLSAADREIFISHIISSGKKTALDALYELTNSPFPKLTKNII